jgi:cytosine/adenosine deaminase-related metal-dependent hydrolase
MRFLAATQIFNGQKFLDNNLVLVLDEQNQFIETINKKNIDDSKIEVHEGIICPGFVNAHCHLELSHLRGVLEKKTGLINFAKGIIAKRMTFTPEQISEAINEADKKMWEEGIVAVGDICNAKDSFQKKSSSKIVYHSFIELIGFNPHYAEVILGVGKQLLDEIHKLNLKGSLVPHAPYSVSEELMRRISLEAGKNPVSIHNQESREEDKFFKEKKGGFVELYDFLKYPIDFFEANGFSSLQKYLPNLSNCSNLLLVHNTFSSEEDIIWANKFHKNLYWCFCVNANLYIENTLPDVNKFIKNNCNICLGTDSLASNDNLSMIDEMNVLLKNFEIVNVEDVLKWSTFNGAEALMLQEQFGSFIKNKNAGLNLLSIKDKAIKFERKLS